MAMDFREYEEAAAKTAVYPHEGSCDGLTYATLGLVGEAGEVAEKIKKLHRDDYGVMNDDRKDLIIREVGDVLWYIAALARELGTDMETIARTNLEKLASRHMRDKVHGDGDTR